MTGARDGWRRYLAEGVVIIAGILIALAADAAWDYRVDRADERTALRQLAAEFAANAAQLDTVEAEHRRGLEGATVMLGAIRGAVELPRDSIRSLMVLLDAPWTFNPKLAALESIISSGQLGLIRDDSLRVELVGWPGIIDDMTEDELNAARYTYTIQYAAVSEALNWGEVFGPEAGRRDRPMAIVGNDDLESVLAYRISWFDSILDELAKVSDASARIRALLSDNLPDR